MPDSLDNLSRTIADSLSLDGLKNKMHTETSRNIVYADTPEDTVDTTYNAPKSIEFKGTLCHPLGNYDASISSPFGMRMHPIDKTQRFHKGIDLAAPSGTPVYASMDGTAYVKYDADGYGKWIQIIHKDGTETRYAHLHTTNVADGGTLKAGDMIGTVGSTGASTGAHLHYEIRQNGTPIDPQYTLEQSRNNNNYIV